MRRVLLAIGATLLGATALTVGLFPILITGPYSKTTVTRLEVDARGFARLELTSTHSSGTCVWVRSTVNGVTISKGGGSGGGFPAWPVSACSITQFNLDPDNTDPEAKLSPEALKGRLHVEEGRTYVIRRDRPLILFKFTGEDGTCHERRIEIE